jgi:hypothetical protein
MVMAMQRRAGNQAVARYLQASRALVARDGTVEAPPATAGQPATGTPSPTSAPVAASGTTPNKTATLKINALFDDVPGESKAKVRKATDQDALWFDPLKTHSNAPDVAESTTAQGVATGGQQQIESFPAPVTGGAKPIGRGSITAQLKYTSQKDASFDVQVAGVKKSVEAKATQTARKFIEGKIKTFGDVDEIQTQADAHLAEAYPGAKTTISVRPKKVQDTGRSTFYYKIRGDAGLLMDVKVVPVGEKQTVSGGSKTTGSSTEDESAKKGSSESGKVDIDKSTQEHEKTTSQSKTVIEAEYNKQVVKTLDDYVQKVSSVRQTVASDLSKKVVTDDKYRDKDHEEISKKNTKITDYTKNVKKGDKNDDNWAERIKKGVKIAKKVTSIPYIDKVPVIGWLTRRVKGWWLDLAEEGLDLFAESGKVEYEDTKVNTKTTDDGKVVDDRNREVTRHIVEDTKRKLVEDFTEKTEEDWKRHLKEVTETKEKYKSTETTDTSSATDKSKDEKYRESTSKEATEEAEKHKAAQNQSVTTTFQVAQTWTYSVPAVNAQVVNGNAEVAASAFGPDPDETSAPAGTPAPSAAPAPTPTPKP